MAEFEKLNALLGEYAVPPASESSAPETKQSLHDLLGEYGNENTKALQIPKSHKSAATDIVHDIGIGTMQIPGAITGLADIPAAAIGVDRPFSRAAEKIGEITGFQPGKWAKEAEQTVYSPERQEAEKRVSEAWDEYDKGKTGIFSAIGKTLSEPRVVAGTVAKSLPSMAGGMGLARGAKALVPALAPEVAAGIGEGTVMAGQQMEQIDKSVAPEKAALASLATGVGGAALSTAGGKIAQKMGLTDIEAAAAGSGAVSEAPPLPFYKRIPGGAIQEGLLEEAPQSALEQAAQNIAEGKEISEGMGRAVTQGAIAGGVMGAGANILPAKQMPEASEETPSQEQAAQQQPAASETQGVDELPVTEDFAEVPTSAEQEPIIVTPEAEQTSQDAYEAAAEADKFASNFKEVKKQSEASNLKRYSDFVAEYEKKIAEGGVPTMVGAPLRNMARQVGVYDSKDTPDVMFEKLKAAVEAMKSPEQKIDEAGQQAAKDSNDSILAQTDGNPGVVSRAAMNANDQGSSSVVTKARKKKAEELAAEQQVEQPVYEIPAEQIDPETGEIRLNLEGQPDDTLKRIWLETGRTPEEKDQARQILESRRAAKLSSQQPESAQGSEITAAGSRNIPTTGEKLKEGWDAAYHLASEAEKDNLDLSKLSRRQYIEYAEKKGVVLSDDQLRMHSSQRLGKNAADIVRLGKEVASRGTPQENSAFDRMVYDAIESTKGAENGVISDGVRVSSSNQHGGSWLHVHVGESTDAKNKDTSKAYVGFHNAARALGGSNFAEFLKVLRDAGYHGQVKIAQDVSSSGRVAMNDQMVMHGRTDADAKLAQEIARQYFGSEITFEDLGNDRPGKSYSQWLAEEHKARVLGAKTPQQTTAEPTTGEANGEGQNKTTQTTSQEVAKPLADQIAEKAYEVTPKGETSHLGSVSHQEIAGLKVSIETPAETYRESKDGAYPPRLMTSHYGNIVNVLGKDGDQLDVFINPKASDDQLQNPKSVFVIDQIDPKTKKYDETKIMLGYRSKAEAKAKYLENYDNGWQGVGAITEMPFAEFKERIDSGKNWDEPLSAKVKVDRVDRGPFHPAIASLAGDLTVGGNMGPIVDDRGKVIGRLKSTNPEWYQTLKYKGPNGGDIHPDVARVKGAVDAYLSGKELDFAQGAILRRLSDIAEGMEQESAEATQREAKAEEENFQARLKDIRTKAKANLPEDLAASWENSIDSGAVTKDNIEEYEKDLESDIEGYKAELEAAKDEEISAEIDNIPFNAAETPNIKHEENKDIDTVKSKFRDTVQKAYEEGDLDIPQYMVAQDMLSSKDPEVLKGLQKFIDNFMPGYGELQRVKAKGSVNVKRLLALVGSSMYKANLADTSIKEMVQNSFDAVKEQIAKNKSLKGQGKIDVLVDSSHRLIAIRDNGVGMTKKTILDAFLTVAGSNKEGLEAGDASGGFGMAKAAFLYGNEKIYLRTVHNGKLSTLEATGAELLDKGVDLATVPTDEPNGTTIIVKVPETVTINGEERYVYFPYGHKSIEFFQKPLLNDDVTISYNNNYVDLQELVNGNADEGLSVNDVFDAAMFGGEVVPTGKNMDMSGYDKATTASFDWGSADIFIGKKRNKYPAHQILSAGVYQFDDSINLRGWEKVPYDILINVKPTVSADSANYPFNLKREGWKDLVEKDIGAMKAYIKQVAMGIEAQETVDVFKNIKAMPTIEVDDIGGETALNVSDFIPKKEVSTAKPSEVFTPPAVSISVGKVTGVDAKGETVTYVDVEAEKAKEKGQEASFKADKDAPTAKDFLLDFGIDPESPVYVNNTSFDFVENDPNIAVFFAELGNILMQAKRKVESLGLYGYKKLSDTPTFMGVSIDKQYHGVHVNVPFHGIFLNPLAVKGTKLPGIVAGLWETMVHEFTHIPEGNHDESFVMEYHNLSSKLAEDGFDIRMRVLLSKTLKKHKDSFLAARENYEASTTKNIARSLHEGENGTGVTSRRAEATRQGGIAGAATGTASALQKQRENQGREGFQRDAGGDIAAQFSRRAPMSQMDLFAESPGELTALQTKQQVADYAAQKDKKRQGNGAEPPPLFSDYPGFMGQTDIEDTQVSLEGTFKAMGKFDKAPETINHPDAERIRYVQDNFLDLLSELEKRQSSEFEIKC